jgi:hypothetical protein
VSSVELVVLGGLPGTGKTTLAAALAGQLDWTVLSSDRIRKELAGLPPDADGRTAFGTGIYTTSWTARTYAELLRRAGELLARDESVILDASWSSAEMRTAAAELAREHHARLVELRCVASPGLARRRLTARPPGPSDAGPEIAARLAAAAAPWPTATVIDTEAGGATAGGQPGGFGSGFDQIVRHALAAIRRPDAERAP